MNALVPWALAVAGVLAVGVRGRLSPRSRIGLAAFVLLVPVVLTAPTTFRADYNSARTFYRLRGSVEPRPAFLQQRNQRLVNAALARIPSGEPYSWAAVSRKGVTDAPLGYGFSFGTVWAQFELAPRVAVTGVPTRWVLVLRGSPRAAGVVPRHAWRFGDDWLVER